MRFGFSVALSALLTMQSAPLHAQWSPWGGPDSPGALLGGDPMEADADRDRRVTTGEFWRWLRGRLERRDRDRDGVVTAQELDIRRGAAAAFRGMDANRDGKLTSDELRYASEIWFRTKDVNGDGALTRQEVPRRSPKPPTTTSRTRNG